MERKLSPFFINQIQGQNSAPQNLSDSLSSKVTDNKPKMALEDKNFAAIDLKLTRINQKNLNTETRLDKFIQDIHLSLSKISSQINEKNMQSSKIESMVEKYNQTILSFEKRMSQVLKVLEERDAQIILLQSIIEESRRELSKLKRL